MTELGIGVAWSEQLGTFVEDLDEESDCFCVAAETGQRFGKVVSTEERVGVVRTDDASPRFENVPVNFGGLVVLAEFVDGFGEVVAADQGTGMVGAGMGPV